MKSERKKLKNENERKIENERKKWRINIKRKIIDEDND